MVLKIDPGELLVTNDLLSDFSAKPSLTAEIVYQASWSRYSALLQTPFPNIINDESLKEHDIQAIYKALPKFIHKFIYSELFTFAGHYRLTKDPRGGRIYFGIQSGHKRTPRFSGDQPDTIEKGIKEAISYLTSQPKDPLYQAMRFYQKFVNVHPFYDANGRIGRMIANVYLANHNLVLNWNGFSRKGKFMQKLNRCHDLPNNETFSYLVNYIKPFSYSTEGYENGE